jgi:hypothetical protein
MTKTTWHELDLTVVTPLFTRRGGSTNLVSGAIPSTNPQRPEDIRWALGSAPQADSFRESALASACAFWFRALVGRSVSLDKLRTLEHEYFGFTSSASNLRFHFLEVPELSTEPWKVDSGIGYLGGQAHYDARTKCILQPRVEAGSKAKLRVSAQDAKAASVLATTLWCAANLGALGSRSLHGFGAVSLSDDQIASLDKEMPLDSREPKQVFAIRNYLREKLGLTPGDEDSQPSFPVVEDHWYKQVIVGDQQKNGAAFSGWEIALNRAGDAARAFRSPVDRGRDYSPFFKRYVTPEYWGLIRQETVEAKDSLVGARGAWLGLPMAISSTPKATPAIPKPRPETWEVTVEGIDRRPAPISIRILPEPNGATGSKILVQGFFDTYLPANKQPKLAGSFLPSVTQEEIADWHRSIMDSFLAGRPRQPSNQRAKRST